MAGSDKRGKSARGRGRPPLGDEPVVRKTVVYPVSLVARAEEEAEARGVKLSEVLRAAADVGLRQMARARRRSRS